MQSYHRTLTKSKPKSNFLSINSDNCFMSLKVILKPCPAWGCILCNKSPNAKIFLFGFSQGAMIALHYGLRDEESFGGILAFSGSLISPERLSEIKNRTPVMLVHGEIDEVVPFSEMIKASKALEQNGINIEKYSAPNLGHGIDDYGIKRALEFMKKK